MDEQDSRVPKVTYFDCYVTNNDAISIKFYFETVERETPVLFTHALLLIKKKVDKRLRDFTRWKRHPFYPRRVLGQSNFSENRSVTQIICESGSFNFLVENSCTLYKKNNNNNTKQSLPDTGVCSDHECTN